MLRSLHLYPSIIIAHMLCAQYTATVKTTVATVESPGWKKWTDKECAMNYPANWTNEGALGTEALATFFAPPDPLPTFRERVSLSSMDVSGRSLTELAQAVEADGRARLANARTAGSALGDDAATFEWMGEMDGHPVRMKHELSVRGDKAWLFTYTAPADRFEESLYLFDAMFMSFMTK